MRQDRATAIIFFVIIVVLFYLLFISNNPPVEAFCNQEIMLSPRQSLENQYSAPTRGIEDIMVDQMPCHPGCCGHQAPLSLDGLTSDRLQQAIQSPPSQGPFVRTNLTCGRGPGGVGCPCITDTAYLALTNRGQPPDHLNCQSKIDPSLYVSTGPLTPARLLELQKTPYLNDRKALYLNDRLTEEASFRKVHCRKAT